MQTINKSGGIEWKITFAMVLKYFLFCEKCRNAAVCVFYLHCQWFSNNVCRCSLVLDDETNKFICIILFCEWWIKCRENLESFIFLKYCLNCPLFPKYPRLTKIYCTLELEYLTLATDLDKFLVL